MNNTTLTATTSSKGKVARNAVKVLRWTEADDSLFYVEDGKKRIEVFPAPFRPGRWCWRSYRFNIYWRHRDGGIEDTIEAAMDAAGLVM